jgi:hypothetical protein
MTIPQRTIPFEAIAAGLSVRTAEDGAVMLALDFVSTLTAGDRKKASQTLARIAARPETAELLTLQRASGGRKHARKTISFANAIQLLMVLPKRTASLQTRRRVAAALVDHLCCGPPCDRRTMSLDRIGQCMELMQRCGPLSEDDASRFRRAIAEHMDE